MQVLVLVAACALVVGSIGTAVALWVLAEVDERRWRKKFGEKP